MRFFRGICIGGVVCLTAFSTAAAECFVCDEVVELDARRAACFLKDFDNYASKAKGMGNGRVEVDLSGCAEGSADNSRGLSAFPFFPGNNADDDDFELPQAMEGLRSVYILDDAGLTCLREVLATRIGPINPTLVVDLVADCQ